MTTVKKYLSLIKFSHTIFAMPFALIGFFLGMFSFQMETVHHSTNINKSIQHAIGDSYPAPQTTLMVTLMKGDTAFFVYKFLLVILCMVFARSAAMSFNRFLDRKFDAKNPRTASREVPSGMISPANALIFSLGCCVLFMACCYLINSLCFLLSPVALGIILGYSYTKRFTPLCHLILGIGLSLAPIGAYMAVTGEFALLPILFSIVVMCWVSGFDIIYALQDVDFDRSQQLYSIPAWIGKAKGLHVSEFLHLLSAAAVIYAGVYGQFHLWYWIGCGIFLFMLIYQHVIVKPNDLSKVNLAFMTANGIASVIFSVFVIIDLYVTYY